MEGKHHRSYFPTSSSGRAKEPLAIVHSDVCGKMNAKSLSGAEYFSLHVGLHFEEKGQSFQVFSRVEGSSGEVQWKNAE